MRGREEGRTSAAVTAVAIVAALFLTFSLPEKATGYAPHAPILIVGDANFTAANGVTAGSGTAADPYVIDGWEINATTSNGIDVRNTTAHFVLRDLFVHGAGIAPFAGVSLNNVSHATAVNVTTTDLTIGVLALDTSGLNASACNLTNSLWGFMVSSSSNISLADNVLTSNTGAGIIILSSTNITLRGNNVSGPGRGITFESVSNVTVANNTVAATGGPGPGGLWAISSDVGFNGVSKNLTFTGNRLVGNSGPALSLYNSEGVLLRDNFVAGNWLGVQLRSATNATVEGNTFLGNGLTVAGLTLPHFNSHLIPANNTVNGLPLRYYKDCAGLDVNGTAIGQLIVANCTAVRVTNLTLMDTDIALQISFADGAVLKGNRFLSNFIGLDFRYTANATVVGNLVAENRYLGAELFRVQGSRIYHNAFVNNTRQADEYWLTNTWHDGYPSGGNYWSDGPTVDNCEGPSQTICPGPDGIGDSDFSSPTCCLDPYPLIAPSPVVITRADLTGVGYPDLTLRWNATGVDGLARGINEYRVLRASALDGPYVPIGTVPVNGSANYSYVCAGCGHVPGDTDTTFYRIHAVGVLDLPPAGNIAARVSRALVPGPNLVSVPLEQSDYGVPAVLRTVSFSSVRAYRAQDAADPWKAYYASRTGDMQQTEFGEALWVNASSTGQYTIAGLVRAGVFVTLAPGWNLVGYASFGNETRDQSLAGVAGVARVETFDAAAAGDPFRLQLVGPSETLFAGEAYWVYLTGSGGNWVQG